MKIKEKTKKHENLNIKWSEIINSSVSIVLDGYNFCWGNLEYRLRILVLSVYNLNLKKKTIFYHFWQKQTSAYFMPSFRRFRNLKWINFPDEIELH